MSQSHLFDDIARTLATPMPRRRVLKAILGSLAGAALASVARPVQAQNTVTPKGGKCPSNYTNCGGAICCPSSRVCCGTVCCTAGQVCQDGQCVNNGSPT